MSFWMIFLFIVVFFLLVATAVFSAIAAADIPTSRDAELNSAFHHLVWASVLSWISVGLVIFAVILYFVFGVETAAVTGSYAIIALIGFVLVMTIVTGILCAIAASNINSSGSKASASNSYRNAIIAAVLALGGIGFLIITMIVFFSVQSHAKTLKKVTVTVPTTTTVTTETPVDVEEAKREAQAILAQHPVASPTARQVRVPAQTAVRLPQGASQAATQGNLSNLTLNQLAALLNERKVV